MRIDVKEYVPKAPLCMECLQEIKIGEPYSILKKADGSYRHICYRHATGNEWAERKLEHEKLEAEHGGNK